MVQQSLALPSLSQRAALRGGVRSARPARRLSSLSLRAAAKPARKNSGDKKGDGFKAGSSSDYGGDFGKALATDGKELGKDIPKLSASGSIDEHVGMHVLARQPLSGGVKNATTRFELPTPAVAVRNLVEQAQYGHLCTSMSSMHHKRAGYPFGSVVDFACDGAGYPIFSLSPLAMHTRNLKADPRCTLVVQMPGWQGLSNARATIFGEVYQLPVDLQDDARSIFAHKHATEAGEEWIGANYSYYRMHKIMDIYFVGGFGTVQWLDLKEFVAAEPDPIVINKMQVTLQVLNEGFSGRIKELLTHEDLDIVPDDAAIISVDKMGIDVRVRFGHDYCVERLGFDEDVHTVEVAKAKLEEITTSPETFHAHNRSAGPSQDSYALFSADISPHSRPRDNL